MMQNFFEELRDRKIAIAWTRDAEQHIKGGKVTGYIGFDPTASSLHVGSLLPIMGLKHMQLCGHTAIAVIGGGTGLIGDPSGKTQERKLLSKDDIHSNIEGIKSQLSKFLDFNDKENPALLVDNADWLTRLSLMEFLRDFGKHFSVSELIAKDSVSSRLEKEQGMSFTEFCYSLLQAFDFLELYDRYGCTLQMGGSDQWGNIVAGIELIRRTRGKEVYGITFPLLTTSSGVKFGKTEIGTIWLDAERTSPYRFYQFWLNVDDKDVIQFLRIFTFLSNNEIEQYHGEAIEGALGWLPKKPEGREAQKKLAAEVTKMVHGETALAQVLKASAIFFGGEITDIDEQALLDIFEDVPSVEIQKDQLSGQGMPFIDLMVTAQVVKSKGEARRLVQGGGTYLNNRRQSDVEKRVSLSEAIGGKFIVLRKGAKSYYLVKVK